MAKTVLTILLIEDSADYAKIVQHWLSQSSGDVEYLLNWTDSVAESRRRLERGGVSVILLDLNLTDSEGASTFAAVRDAAPGVPIIILSAGDDVAMALHLIQEGADNYLVKGNCSPEVLTRAIRYAIVKNDSNSRRQRAKDPGESGSVIGVVGGKGGVGATSVACTMASELRRRSGDRVLLADFDIQAGLVAFLLAVESQYTILDAASNAGRLDRSLWQQIVCQSDEGIDVACSPALNGSGAAPMDQLEMLVSEVRPFYRWIVLDLGRLYNCPPGLLKSVDELVVITTGSIPALYETKRAVEILRAAGLGDRIRLTYNCLEPPADGCAAKDLRSIFGVTVAATLPNSGRELNEACVQKKTPDKNSAFRREIGKLIEAIGGPQEAEPKRSLAFLPERLRRFGKSAMQPAVK